MGLKELGSSGMDAARIPTLKDRRDRLTPNRRYALAAAADAEESAVLKIKT